MNGLPNTIPPDRVSANAGAAAYIGYATQVANATNKRGSSPGQLLHADVRDAGTA
jgi:hypothetical protein